MGKRRRQGDPSRDGCESTDSEDGGQEEPLSCPHVGKAASLAAVKKTLKIAWVKVGNCTTCTKENKVVSQVKKGPKAKAGAKLTAAEIKKEQLERAKAEQRAAAEKLRKEKEAKERLAATAEKLKGEEEGNNNTNCKTPENPDKDKTEKETVESKTAAKPAEPPSIWLCLKCGFQGCSSSEKNHSVQHYRQPRSDLHCLVVNISTWTIWCYECEHEVFVDSHKKLYEAVEYIKKVKEQGVKQVNVVTPKSGFGTIQPLGGGALSRPQQSGTATYTKGGLLKIKGLSNLGNTCFFNSVMQCLNQTHLLTSLLELQAVKGVSLDVPGVEGSALSTNEESESDVDGLGLESFAGISVQLAEGGPMVTSLAAFFKEMGSQGKTGVFSPSQLFAQVVKQAPKFRGLQQQDSHELLRYLMDGLRNEEQRRQKSAILKHFGLTEKTDPKSVVKSMRRKLRVYGRQANHTLLDRVFSGQLVSTIVCEECGHSSRRYEQFLDISLPVVEDKPHKPMKKHHNQHNMAPAGDDPNNTEIGCVALEKKSKSRSKKEKERKRKEKRLKGKKGKSASVSKDDEEELVDEEKIRADLEEFEEKPGEKEGPTAEIDLVVDPNSAEIQTGDNKLSGEDVSTIEDNKTTSRVVEELEDEKRVITASGFRRHASLVEENEHLAAVRHAAGNDDEGYEEEEGGRCLEEEADWEWDYGDSVVDDKQALKIKARTPETTLDTSPGYSEDASINNECPDDEEEEAALDQGQDYREKSSEKTGENSDEDLDDEETGASSNGDVEDNTDEDDVRKWVVDKNYLNNLKKLDDLMQVGENLDPHMSQLCKGIASLDLGMRAQKRERVEAEWTSRTLATLAPRYQVSAGECSLYSCLNSFTQSELLTGSNKWACDRCTQIAASNPNNSDAQESNKVEGEKKPKTVYSSASKQMLVFSPPAVLTLQLKRFQQTMSGCKKVNKHVTFPATLDLAAFCSSTCVALPHMSLDPTVQYSLYGVVEHSGSLRGGHYVAYVKTRPNGSPYQDLSTFFNPPLARASDVPSFLEEVDRKLKRNKAVIKDKEEEEVEDAVNNNKNQVEKELETPGKGRWFHVSDSSVQEVQEDKRCCLVMGKHKKEHKEHKHKHRERGGSQDDSQEPPVLVPKLIVKLGSPSTENREASPAAPLLEQQGGLDDQHHHHHHRHKDKKKKKKKDKKKSHEKDREHREHRHHHKSKKRKRDHGDVVGGEPVYSPPPSNLLPSLNSPESGVTPSPEPAAKRQRLTSGESASTHLQSPRRELPSRSCVQKPPGPLGKILEYLLLMLEKKDLNNFFASPVSDTFAPGYSNIIKEAMDFSTMREKIEDSKYKSLEQFRHDFSLICNNCMTYNLPDTVYFKTAKKLLQQGQRILAPERLRALAEHLPLIKDLSKDELGFDMSDEVPATELEKEHREDVSKYIEEIRGSVKRPPGKFEAIPDPMTPEELAAQTKAAAKGAAERLVRRRVSGQMGYLKNRSDGSASLAIITSDPDSSASGSGVRVEKPVTLAQLVGKVKNGTSALTGFKEDRRNNAKAIHPLYYGAYSSHGPTHDSTFANLTKAETELVYSTYGDDVGVSYAESIKNFSRNCEYATFIVDHLLDILTDQQHRKTSKFIEEQKMLREEESVVDEAFTDSKVDFDSLKSLEKDGIDMSFLGDLEKKYNNLSSVKLETTAGLLEELRSTQHERLSNTTNLTNLPEVGAREAELAGAVQGGLADMVASLRPRDLVNPGTSLSGVRRALGVPPTSEL